MEVEWTDMALAQLCDNEISIAPFDNSSKYPLLFY